MSKENCTKGPYRLHEVGGENSVNDYNAAFTGNDGRTPIAHVEFHDFYDDNATTDEQEANAELIAEAFNTLHETGYTPAELAEQNAALETALADMVSTANEVEGMMDGDKDKQEAWEEELSRLYIAIDAAKAVLSKYQPVTPT